MSYFYDYTGSDGQDLLVESDDVRPDLLEWAYWREISAEEAAKRRPKPADPEPKRVPAKKAAPAKAAGDA